MEKKHENVFGKWMTVSLAARAFLALHLVDAEDQEMASSHQICQEVLAPTSN